MIECIRERSPMTVAAFMELALYDPEFGYYARAAQRSGRAGDFFTSVDVGAVFGELLEVQLAEMAAILESQSPHSPSCFDLVEVGAGNGRLSADIVRAARRRDPALAETIRLHLVEASPAARAVHRATLADVVDRLASSESSLPESFQGVLLANELLDAFGTHQVVMRANGLREMYVVVDDRHSAGGSSGSGASRPDEIGASGAGVGTGPPPPVLRRGHRVGSHGIEREAHLTLVEGPLSTPRLAEYLDRLGITLDVGWRGEINLCAIDWIQQAARRLQRGFIILIDYGHPARELYSQSHSGGTLTTFARHQSSGPEAETPPWLQQPGERDITAHVDFTSVQRAAEDAGLVTLGLLDQTYFLLGLMGARGPGDGSGSNDSSIASLDHHGYPEDREDLKRRLALKTLLLPGGLGSTHKVLILGKGVGTPSLVGCSYRQPDHVNATAWIGLAVMVGSEAATLAHIEPFWTWNTPIAWTGFILFADGIVWRARGTSWLRSNPGEFAFLAVASIPLWLVFEGYNQVIANWYYTGLPQQALWRYVGYAWSFSTIWPAIFEAGELAAILRPKKTRTARATGPPSPPALSVVLVAAGTLMLAAPFIVSPHTARYLAAPVWLGFIFLLDPINGRLGGPSLFADIGAHRYDRVINLAISGWVCGVLWEFWNYWARSKWHYTVPIMSNLKIFEMPVPGYLGFPAFALECFTMYIFVRQMFVGRLGRTIAL